jgi:hypothetical protein
LGGGKGRAGDGDLSFLLALVCMVGGLGERVHIDRRQRGRRSISCPQVRRP